MTPVLISPRVKLLQVLIVCVALLFAGMLGFLAWQKYLWGVSQLADLEPRHARLLGLQASGATLTDTLASVQTLLSRSTYPVDQDTAQAGNAAQQQIRTLFADSKLDVISIQVLPPKELKHFDRIGVVVRVEGELVGLHNAMSLLDAQTPTVWLDSLSIQTVGLVKPKSAQRLAAQFSLSVLRRRL